MAKLHEQLKYFVAKKVSTDRLWQGPRIYLSGHEVRLILSLDLTVVFTVTAVCCMWCELDIFNDNNTIV